MCATGLNPQDDCAQLRSCQASVILKHMGTPTERNHVTRHGLSALGFRAACCKYGGNAGVSDGPPWSRLFFRQEEDYCSRNGEYVSLDYPEDKGHFGRDYGDPMLLPSNQRVVFVCDSGLNFRKSGSGSTPAWKIHDVWSDFYYQHAKPADGEELYIVESDSVLQLEP